MSGKASNVITTGSFTYVEVETARGKIWSAGPVTPIKKGDVVSFSTSMPMQNFHSKALGRDFAMLFITNHFFTGKENSATSSLYNKIKQPQIIKPSMMAMAGTAGEVKVGGFLREVTLDGLNGKSKTFSSFKGKPLIINIWASWCGPCRSEMGSLERLAQRYNGKDFNIIGISTDDYRNKAIALIKQTGISFENFIDHNLLLEKMLGAKTIPLTILVGADGRVLKIIHGARKWDSVEMVDAIANVFHIKLKR
ncbi:MAG: TlpA disulfide reductase family protein [Woeseiaceae bacterium]